MSSDQPAVPKWLDKLWAAALEDAQSDDLIKHCVLLYPQVGRNSPDGFRAKSWSYGVPPNAGEVADPVDFESIKANQFVNRVAIWTAGTKLGIAGLLRHELEHIRQDAYQRKQSFDDFEQLGQLHVDALRSLAGGSGLLYQTIPMEADANAAASMFLRKRYGNRRIERQLRRRDRNGEKRPRDLQAMRSTQGPESMSTLIPRMRAFIEAHKQNVTSERLGDRQALAVLREAERGSHLTENIVGPANDQGGH